VIVRQPKDARSPESTARSSWIETVHIGRQPIVLTDGRLYGYELLFRDRAGAGTATHDGDSATTSTIIAAFSEFGIDALLDGRRGFVNLSRSFLVGELPLPFGPEIAALEILETIERDAEAIAGAQRLAAAGYDIVLDDFTWTPGVEPLLDVAEIVKIDVLSLPWGVVLETLDQCRPFDTRMLAEKVETHAMLEQCSEVGFDLFQGYHLGRPETRSTTTLSPSQAQSLQILASLSDPDATPATVEDAVLHEPALMYRLLRIANSASAGINRPISSIRETLILVGLSRLRAWLVLLSMSSTAAGSAIGLTSALVRARMCEVIAEREGMVQSDVAFTVGLLDGLAESLGLVSSEMPAFLPFHSPELSGTGTGHSGPMQILLDSVRAYEADDERQWVGGRIAFSILTDSYLDALAWTANVTHDTLGA
jgi:EAL and modified HD-GYP domain-containing signal transduction protein